MNNSARWLLLVVIAAAVMIYLYLSQTSDVLTPDAARLPVPEAQTEPASEPQISYPIVTEQEQFETPVARDPLPLLADSDAAMTVMLIGLVGDAAFEQLFRSENIVQRIVTTVDNLDRKKLAPKILPLQSAGGEFMVSRETGNLSIAEENHQRYAAYVILTEAIDTNNLVAAYSRYYPLFQEAYTGLGYPAAYFNDRLVAVIDHLLATPDVQPPFELVKPEAFYLYADPDLESLSAGQKNLLRLGPEHGARIRSKLQEIRLALSQPSATPEDAGSGSE